MSVTPVQSTSDVQDQVSAAEWQPRVDLAACYRLVALQGWDVLIFTQIKSAQGMGGALAWPALLRKLDQQAPGYRL